MRDAKAEYQELVRLAYFVLPGTPRRTLRMAMARRIVESTHGGRSWRRNRVLRRAMRPSPLWRVGLRPWLRGVPTRLPDASLTNALALLDPKVRLAWVMLNLEELPRHEVRDQLLDLRVPDQLDVIEAAEAAEIPLIRMRPHADPFVSGRIKPAGRRAQLPVVVAAAATLVAVGGASTVVVQRNGGLPNGWLGGDDASAAAKGLSLIAAAPEAWRAAPRNLDSWPARGDLTGDKEFTSRVLRAWGDAGGHGNPQLLFAGHVDGQTVALVRRGDRIGRFNGRGPMAVSQVSTNPSAPLLVSRGRYLIAPWDEAVSLAGKKVRVRQGLTDPSFPRTRCGRGPVLYLSGEDKTMTVGEFGGTRAVPLTYRWPFPGKKELRGQIKGHALRVWERTACLAPVKSGPVEQATAWEFWSGLVPLGGGRAQWVCTGMGSSAQAVLLDKRGMHDMGRCDGARPVGGSWWRSARGDWYYVAAAGPGLTPQATGAFSKRVVRARLLIAVPKERKRRPAEPVKLTARRA